jgi:hypothetical protein
VKVIQTNSKESFDMHIPVEIITLLKSINTECGRFKKGEKFIYVVGERHGQRNSINFFEYCKDVPKEIIDNLNIFFTEYFPSDDIFDNNETTKLVLHEEFPWNYEE